MMDLRQFLYNKVGDVLTESDFTWCIGQLAQMDRLAQNAHNQRAGIVIPATVLNTTNTSAS